MCSLRPNAGCCAASSRAPGSSVRGLPLTPRHCNHLEPGSRRAKKHPCGSLQRTCTPYPGIERGSVTRTPPCLVTLATASSNESSSTVIDARPAHVDANEPRFGAETACAEGHRQLHRVVRRRLFMRTDSRVARRTPAHIHQGLGRRIPVCRIPCPRWAKPRRPTALPHPTGHRRRRHRNRSSR